MIDAERNSKTTGKETYNSEGVMTQALEVLQLFGSISLLLIKVLWYMLEAIFRLVKPVTEKSVNGEIVLITGSGHGIGKELALQYASQKATVVCWDINKKDNEEVVKEIAKLGYPKAHAYVCNVTNREHVIEIAKRVEREVGDVSILINNAGIMPCRPFLEQTTEEIERTMNINVMSHFWTLQAFLPTMRKNNRGHVVAISSGCGLMPIRNLVPYCASKFAVRGMMEALFQDLQGDPKNLIKVTLIYPSMVNTGLCKKPVIRFPNFTPLLNARFVAKYIMKAQRREMFETTIPRHLLSVHYSFKLLPVKAHHLIQDFMSYYVDSDQ